MNEETMNEDMPSTLRVIKLRVLPDDLLRLIALRADTSVQTFQTSLPPDVRVQDSAFLEEHNLLSLLLHSDFFEPAPVSYENGKRTIACTQVFFKLVDDPTSPLAAPSDEAHDDLDREPREDPVDPADYPPAPDFMAELFSLYEATGRMEFRVRALVFHHDDVLKLLRGPVTWDEPFSLPSDVRFIGARSMDNDQHIFWLTHPTFEPCKVLIDEGDNNQVLIELRSQGRQWEFRVPLVGATAKLHGQPNADNTVIENGITIERIPAPKPSRAQRRAKK